MVACGDKGGRLQSLDALRGFDMLMIMGFGTVAVCALKACGCGADSALVQQFSHVDWHGLRFEDTIFALFLFIAGVSFPFSFAKRCASGSGRGRMVVTILRRAFLLFLLGLVYNGLCDLNFKNLVWGSVLGRIGVAWALAALVYVFCGLKARVAVATGILLGYWTLTFAVQAPDFPDASVLTPQGNFACYVDRLLMPGKLTVAGLYTNQGLLGTVSAVVTAMLGMFAGDLLRVPTLGGTRKAGLLALGAVALTALGLVVAFGCGAWSFPINKKLWSPSFVLVVGGYSAAMLALFYWLVDVRGWTRWTFFFRVIGLNSITIYLAKRFIPFGQIAKGFLGGLAGLLPKAWGDLLLATGALALAWLFLWFLHRHKTYLKV